MTVNGTMWPDEPDAFDPDSSSHIHEYAGLSFRNMVVQPAYSEPILPSMDILNPHIQPLMTTPWPSMLTSHTSYLAQNVHSPPQNHLAEAARMPAPATASSRFYIRERRTLTDEQRRRMCRFAQDHPTKKQTEIGSLFGVERSTVSKVLRNKDKYLAQDDSIQSHVKSGRRFPDIEKAVANWARNEIRNGSQVTDDQIFEQIKHFARTVVSSDHHLKGINGSWLETFKHRNGLLPTKRRTSNSSEQESMIADSFDHLDCADVLSDSTRCLQNTYEFSAEAQTELCKAETPPSTSNATAQPQSSYVNPEEVFEVPDSEGRLQSDDSLSDTSLAKDLMMPAPLSAPTRARSQTFPAQTDISSIANMVSRSTAPSMSSAYETLLSLPAYQYPNPSVQELHQSVQDVGTGSLAEQAQNMFAVGIDGPEVLRIRASPSLPETQHALAVIWSFLHDQTQTHHFTQFDLSAIESLMERLDLHPSYRKKLATATGSLDGLQQNLSHSTMEQ